MKTIVYVGASDGGSLKNIIDQNNDDLIQVYAFEPSPQNFVELTSKLGDYDNVELVNAACGLENGKSTLYITRYENSSSIGKINHEFLNTENKVYGAEILKTIEIDMINLYDYLTSKGVTEVDSLITDCQGSDLNVLSTIINTDIKIHNITCETHNNGVVLYHGLQNSFDEHKKLLGHKYEFLFGVPSGDDGVLRWKYPQDKLLTNTQLNEWDSYWRLK